MTFRHPGRMMFVELPRIDLESSKALFADSRISASPGVQRRDPPQAC